MRAAAALCLFCASTAIAQQPACNPNRTEVQEARTLFSAGAAAVEAGRWSDAIQSFDRSYALSCAPSALYNLALALRALGRHRDARDQFARLLRAHPDMSAELRQDATSYQAEEAGRVAVLELIGMEGSPAIRFDGAAITDNGERPLHIETDAGTHSLVAERPEYRPFLWNGSLRDGEHLQLQLQFTPLPVNPPGFDWTPVILIGGGSLLAIAGLIIGIAVAQDQAQLRALFPMRAVML